MEGGGEGQEVINLWETGRGPKPDGDLSLNPVVVYG